MGRPRRREPLAGRHGRSRSGGGHRRAGARADETETDAAGGTVGAAGTDAGARADAERVRQAAAWAWGAGGMATVMEAGDGTDEGKSG